MNIMLNFVNKPYNELQDMSLTMTQLLAQLLTASIGIMALMVICYGLIKLILRER
jgi:hypothetical protein